MGCQDGVIELSRKIVEFDVNRDQTPTVSISDSGIVGRNNMKWKEDASTFFGLFPKNCRGWSRRAMEPNSGYDGSQGILLFASTITASLCFGSSRFKLGENSKNEKAPAENHTRLCFHFDRYVLQIYLYAFGEDSCQPSVFLHNSTYEE